MATELSPAQDTIDLTGLPAPVVQGIRHLVRALREEHGSIPLVGTSVGTSGSMFISSPQPTPEEMERLLDELSSGQPGKILSPDFSRADIYDDHD